MILEQCPHCNTRHIQTMRQGNLIQFKNTATYWSVERCQNKDCARLILVEVDETLEKGLVLFPFVSYELDATANLPSLIVDDFREASLCLGARCYMASLVMSRRVLQRCLADQGCTQNRLVDAINYAIANNILRKSFHPLAEEIRQYGNLGAHPDDDQLSNANHDNAHQVLEFARLLIHEFYEIPASAQKLKASRT